MSRRRLSVDLRIYTLESVFRTAYKFSGQAYLKLQRTSEGLDVTIEPKSAQTGNRDWAGEFENELIDQNLRAIVATETAVVRDLIMAHALSRTPLVRPDWEHQSPL